MLKIAQDMSKAVIQEAETGTFALFDACEELSYYSLFNIDDGDGNVSNHQGIGKSANKEFIINNPYDYTLRRSGKNIAHMVATWQCVNISAYLGESYVCTNGLPIYLSTSGSLDDAYYNPEFGGYDTYMGNTPTATCVSSARHIFLIVRCSAATVSTGAPYCCRREISGGCIPGCNRSLRFIRSGKLKQAGCLQSDD